jgi:hypothetical protein
LLGLLPRLLPGVLLGRPLGGARALGLLGLLLVARAALAAQEGWGAGGWMLALVARG